MASEAKKSPAHNAGLFLIPGYALPLENLLKSKFRPCRAKSPRLWKFYQLLGDYFDENLEKP
jgi:hypothetical protein